MRYLLLLALCAVGIATGCSFAYLGIVYFEGRPVATWWCGALAVALIELLIHAGHHALSCDWTRAKTAEEAPR
jgi:hypothetical protein